MVIGRLNITDYQYLKYYLLESHCIQIFLYFYSSRFYFFGKIELPSLKQSFRCFQLVYLCFVTYIWFKQWIQKHHFWILLFNCYLTQSFCRISSRKPMPKMHLEMLYLEISVFIYNNRFVDGKLHIYGIIARYFLVSSYLRS